MSQFATEGFDLDKIQAGEGDEVVYELGGGATVVQTAPPPEENNEPELLDGIGKAEEWKQKGNEEFKQGSYLEAYDLYTEAIMAFPGELKGDQILKLKEEYEEDQREKMYSRQKLAEEERRRAANNKEEESTDKKNVEKAEEFKLPQQEFGDKLAIYYCNRGAALLYMNRYDEAIQDADVAVLLNPKYVKAYVRRSMAYEKTGEKTEDALLDAKKALELDPTNATIRKSVARLQKIEDERLEKMKEETIGKLKDLGNSILGNFGLSMDSFNAVQDPNTGSYNIQFNQNKS